MKSSKTPKYLIFGVLVFVLLVVPVFLILRDYKSSNSNSTNPSDSNDIVWVVPEGNWAAVGAIYVNENPVFNSVEGVGDITILKTGNYVRAPWGFGKVNLFDQSISEVVETELVKGCGKSTGCDSVNVHTVQDDGLFITKNVSSASELKY